jgi:methionyl-tRNA formyltransferase
MIPQPQNEAEATYCGPISKEAGEIDWHLPAVDIWRRVRAFYRWPGCYTKWQGKQLKIIEAIPLSDGDFKVGTVVPLTKDKYEKAAFGVCTKQGILGILKVQMEGKRVMSAAEFLRGQQQLIGSVLPN